MGISGLKWLAISALAGGTALSFIDLQVSALLLLCSIGLSYLADKSLRRLDAQNMAETLPIVLELAVRCETKAGAMMRPANPPTRPYSDNGG